MLCASARCATSLACNLHNLAAVLSANALALLSLLPADCLLILSLLLQVSTLYMLIHLEQVQHGFSRHNGEPKKPQS